MSKRQARTGGKLQLLEPLQNVKGGIYYSVRGVAMMSCVFSLLAEAWEEVLIAVEQ